jgi:hypothetical protein
VVAAKGDNGWDVMRALQEVRQTAKDAASRKAAAAVEERFRQV